MLLAHRGIQDLKSVPVFFMSQHAYNNPLVHDCRENPFTATQ